MDELSWGMFSLGMAFIIAALVILSQKPSHLTGTHTDEVDEHGNPVLARNKSFSPMLVSGAALEHLNINIAILRGLEYQDKTRESEMNPLCLAGMSSR